MAKKRALFLINPNQIRDVFGPEARLQVATLVHVHANCYNAKSFGEATEDLSAISLILGGWGMPKLDEVFFQRLPNVRAVFYSGGAVGRMVDEHFFARNVPLTNAHVPNGFPVAEYSAAMIQLCLKQTFQMAANTRAARAHVRSDLVAGAYKSTVGILSLGAIGREVVKRIRLSDVDVIAFDPFCSSAAAQALGVTLVSLDEVFARADVVSCHTPWLPETENLLRGSHFASMKPRASFVNTARGAIVNEPEMISVLQSRPDLYAVLDVTWPEPPAPDSPLFTLPNVMLTPHIAGSLGPERLRLGQTAVDEMARWLKGEPLHHLVSPQYARAYG